MKLEIWDNLVQNAPWYARSYLSNEREFERGLVETYAIAQKMSYDLAEQELAGRNVIFSELERTITDYGPGTRTREDWQFYNITTKRAIQEFGAKKVRDVNFPDLGLALIDWPRKYFSDLETEFKQTNPTFEINFRWFWKIGTRNAFFQISFLYSVEED